MDDETLRAILQRIVVEPDEDTHRLVFADAMEERGRLVSAGSGGTDDRVIAGRIRCSIEERWEPQRIDWTSKWWPLPDDGMTGWYSRGFYEGVECTAELFLRHADELIWHPDQNRPCPLTAQPIRRVVLTTVPVYGFTTEGKAGVSERLMTHWVPRGEGYDHSQKWIAKTLCELEWPGVEFELPG